MPTSNGTSHKWVQPLWETVAVFFTKLNIVLLYNPTIMLLEVLPNWIVTICSHINICRRFINYYQKREANTMSFNWWINRIQYICTVIHAILLCVLHNNVLFFSGEKEWAILSYAQSCIKLNAKFPVRNLSGKAKYSIIPFLWYHVKGKTIET